MLREEGRLPAPIPTRRGGPPAGLRAQGTAVATALLAREAHLPASPRLPNVAAGVERARQRVADVSQSPVEQVRLGFSAARARRICQPAQARGPRGQTRLHAHRRPAGCAGAFLAAASLAARAAFSSTFCWRGRANAMAADPPIRAARTDCLRLGLHRNSIRSSSCQGLGKGLERLFRV